MNQITTCSLFAVALAWSTAGSAQSSQMQLPNLALDNAHSFFANTAPRTATTASHNFANKVPKKAVSSSAYTDPSNVVSGITGFLASGHNPIASQTSNNLPITAAGFSEEQLRILNGIRQGIGGQKINIKFRAINATPSFITGLEEFSRTRHQKMGIASPSAEDTARDMVRQLSPLFKAPDLADNLLALKHGEDSNGFQYIRYQQQYQGIPVFGKQLLVHLSPQQTVTAVNGDIFPVSAMNHVQSLAGSSTQAQVTSDEAVSAAIRHMQLSVSEAYQVVKSPTLVYFDVGSELKLAYSLTISTDFAHSWNYIVDAHNGEVIKRYTTAFNEVVNGQGLDMHSQTREFKTWKQDGNYWLVDQTLPHDEGTYEPINGGFADFGNMYIMDAQNNRDARSFIRSSSPNSGWSGKAVSAAYNTKTVYDYYKNVHGRDSYDGKQANLVAVINVDNNYNNAVWSNNIMWYGDGDNQIFSPLVQCLDVAGHEMSHGVIGTTAGLLYENQSGALNESFADVFGAMVDREDWLLGEDCTLASPGHLRSMINPASGVSAQPSKLSEYRNLPNTEAGDNGGVHINSGIPNRAAYLIAEGLSNENLGTSIGRNKTEKIYYRAITQYLTPTSQFIDARRALIQAAEDLYGANSIETQAVAAAFDQVEITDGDNSTPGGDTPSTPADPLSGDDYAVYLAPHDNSNDGDPDDTFDAYAYHFDAGFSGYKSDDDLGLGQNLASTRPAFAMVDNEPFGFFIDTNANIYSSSLVTPSPTQITDSSNAGSFSFAPDNHYFAFTTNTRDGKIYVYNVNTEELVGYELPPISYTSESPITSNALYADGLSFNYKSSVLAFDVLQCISLPESSCESDGGYSFWTIGLLNLNTGTIVYPFGEQNPKVDVGFPTFSNTDDMVLAFDVIDRSGSEIHASTRILDLNKGEIVDVVDHAPGWHASAPSFWGDDSYLVYTGKVSDARATSLFRIALNDGTPNGSPEAINDYAALLPIMGRAGVRDLETGLKVNSSSVNFGDTQVNASASQEVVIENNNNFDIRIVEIETTEDFRHSGINQVISRGSQYHFNVMVTDTSTPGARAGNLTIKTETGQEIVVPLSAQVVTQSDSPTPSDPDNNSDNGNGGSGGGGGTTSIPMLLMLGLLVALRSRMANLKIK